MEISTKRTILLLLISIYTFSFSSAQIQEIDEVKIISNGKHLSGIECSSDVNAIIGDFLGEF